MCCAPVSLGTFLLIALCLSAFGEALVEMVGEDLEKLVDSASMRYVSKTLGIAFQFAGAVIFVVLVLAVLLTWSKSSTAAASTPTSSSDTVTAVADPPPTDASSSESVTVDAPAMSTPTEPAIAPLDVSALPVEEMPPLPPLDAHALPIAAVELMETSAVKSIRRPTARWWRR